MLEAFFWLHVALLGLALSPAIARLWLRGL
jgi:hypothetical protein